MCVEMGVDMCELSADGRETVCAFAYSDWCQIVSANMCIDMCIDRRVDRPMYRYMFRHVYDM